MRQRRSSPVQDAILEFLADFKRDPENDGNSPTYREIAEGVGKSIGDTYRRILVMERRGVLRINKRGKIILIGGRYFPPGAAD